MSLHTLKLSPSEMAKVGLKRERTVKSATLPVGGDADVEAVGLAPPRSLQLALLGRAEVGEQLEGRAPLLELHLPVQRQVGSVGITQQHTISMV